jgi:hypothetical protein
VLLVLFIGAGIRAARKFRPEQTISMARLKRGNREPECAGEESILIRQARNFALRIGEPALLAIRLIGGLQDVQKHQNAVQL